MSTSPSADQSPGPGLLRRAASEPLLQFLLLGALLFIASALFTHWRDNAQRRIVIDAQLVEWQRNLYRAQFGTWPDSEALEALVQAYIRDEALYREAVRLGLGVDDEVIRQRMAQKMEFVLTDATVPPEPDDAMLQQFLDEHAAQYSDGGRVSFDQLYFADTPDREGGRARALAALQALGAGQAGIEGDPFALDRRWSAARSDDLRRRFGDSGMAEAPMQAPLEQWSGPYRSGYGWHLLRVTARAEAIPPSLDLIRDRVRGDWLADFRQRDLAARIGAIIDQHQIQRLDRSR